MNVAITMKIVVIIYMYTMINSWGKELVVIIIKNNK